MMRLCTGAYQAHLVRSHPGPCARCLPTDYATNHYLPRLCSISLPGLRGKERSILQFILRNLVSEWLQNSVLETAYLCQFTRHMEYPLIILHLSLLLDA
jgi:hypothetical protein